MTKTNLSICITVVLLCLLFAGCSREEDRREQLRIQRIEQEMVKLRDEIAAWKQPQPRANKNFDKRVPDWKDDNEALVRCGQLLDRVLTKMEAKQFTEITPLSIEGIETADRLDARAQQRRHEAEKQAKSSESENTLESVGDAFVGAYFAYLQGAALLYQRRFVQPLEILSLNGPPSERIAVFERIASLYSVARPPAIQGLMAELLQKALAGEDDSDNKARMEQKLKEFDMTFDSKSK